MSQPNKRLRVLYLLPFAPSASATHGGGRVISEFVKRMAERHEVALLYLRALDEPPLDDALRQRCVLAEEVLRPGVPESSKGRWQRRVNMLLRLCQGVPMQVTDWSVPAYAERLRALLSSWRPDLIQFEYHMMTHYMPALNGCVAPRILTEYEPGIVAAHERWRAAQGWSRLVAAIDLWAWRRFETAALRQVRAAVVFTERDRLVLTPLAGTTPLVTIPFGVALPEHPLDPLGIAPLQLVFVGSFIHAPNIDAAQRLISDIFPLVRAACPDVTLLVVGDQPPAALRATAGDGVTVTGYVPDVTPFLDQAAVVVVPLRLGGGMRVKVLEALAAGKAVVASALAVEGLNVVPGVHVLVAESNAAFADAIVHLMNEPSRRAAMAMAGRRWALDNLSWNTTLATYEQLYQQLVQPDLPRDA